MFTFKNTHLIIFKFQEYLCLAIFGKPMIQVYGKTILSMEFKSIIKVHDSNPWQFIHPKPNSHWQHQSPIFIGITLSKRKEPRIIKRLAKKKICHVTVAKKKICHVTVAKKGSWQSSYEETHWELSWGLCSRIINPWNTWTLFAT